MGADTVGRPVTRELIGTKAPLVLRELPNQGQDWRVSYALFTRAGASEAARHRDEIIRLRVAASAQVVSRVIRGPLIHDYGIAIAMHWEAFRSLSIFARLYVRENEVTLPAFGACCWAGG